MAQAAFSGPRAFLFTWTIMDQGRGETIYTHTKHPGQPDHWTSVAPGHRWPSTFLPSPTYLGSFLQKSDDDRSVPAAHCPIQRAHSAVVDVLNHGPVIHQELDLARGSSRAFNTSAWAHHFPRRALAAACPLFNGWSEPGWVATVF